MLRVLFLIAFINVALVSKIISETRLLAYSIGAPNWRIIGGIDAPEGKYPWMVSLRNQRNAHFCGGSILDETTVLTAAHCADSLKPEAVTVNVGNVNLNETTGKYNVANIRVHPKWNYNDLKNDILILKLASPIKYSSDVQPIELPKHDNLEQGEAWLSGWGSRYLGGPSPNRLQEFHVNTITTRNCVQYNPPFPVDSTQVCTFTKLGQGACHGDSGSPLVNSNGEQIGIASWVMIPCAEGKPDVFTRVYSFLDWIEQNRK